MVIIASGQDVASSTDATLAMWRLTLSKGHQASRKVAATLRRWILPVALRQYGYTYVLGMLSVIQMRLGILNLISLLLNSF